MCIYFKNKYDHQNTECVSRSNKNIIKQNTDNVSWSNTNMINQNTKCLSAYNINTINQIIGGVSVNVFLFSFYGQTSLSIFEVTLQ